VISEGGVGKVECNSSDAFFSDDKFIAIISQTTNVVEREKFF
jgi:hypothetical protein